MKHTIMDVNVSKKMLELALQINKTLKLLVESKQNLALLPFKKNQPKSFDNKCETTTQTENKNP